MKKLSSKKLFPKHFLFISIIFLLFIIVLLLTTKRFQSFQTFFANFNQNSHYDFNADGNDDELQVINGQNKIDYTLKTLHKDYVLSDYASSKTIFTLNHHLEPFVYIGDISRDKIPELLLMGSKNNKNVSYLFYFFENTPKLMEIESKNITGILDSKNSKTPQLFFIDSKDSTNSFKSIMLVCNEIVDTSKSNNVIPSLNNIIRFINIIELPYTVDDIPDIFTQNIDKTDLSILWHLNKDNLSYSFQNGFFYDYEWDDYGNPVNINCRLSFSKTDLKNFKSKNSEEFIISLNLTKSDSSYKISSIKIQ